MRKLFDYVLLPVTLFCLLGLVVNLSMPKLKQLIARCSEQELTIIQTPELVYTDEGKIISLFVDPQDPRLVKSAYERAVCIDRGDCSWSHERWTDFAKNNLKAYRIAGEILARHFYSWDEAILGWKNSASHSAVMNMKWCQYGASNSGSVYVVHYACER